MTRRNPNLGRIVAAALIAAGLAGTVIDPNGVVGVVLFSAAAAALLYLVARPIARLAATASRRVGGFSPRRVPLLISARTIIAIAFTAGVLLGATNLFDENGDAAIGRVLNDATFLGGFLLIATIAIVLLGTAARWTRSACVTR